MITLLSGLLLRRLVLVSCGLVSACLLLEVVMRVALDPYTCDAALGWRYRPDTSVLKVSRALGYQRVATFNRFGFHDRDHPREKPPRSARVVLIGDSVVAGTHVDLVDHFVGRLNSAALQTADGRTIELLNMAVDGYGTVQQLLALATAWQWNPDVVIVGVFAGNDLTDNLPHLNEVGHYLAARCGRPCAQGDGIGRPEAAEDGVLAALERIALRRSVVWANLVGRSTGKPRLQHPEFQANYARRMDAAWRAGGRQMVRLLRQMQVQAQARGVRFGAMLLPERRDLLASKRGASAPKQLIQPEKQLIEALRAASIPVLDLYAAHRAQPGAGRAHFLPDLVHLNKTGHAFMAAQLAPWLRVLTAR